MLRFFSRIQSRGKPALEKCILCNDVEKTQAHLFFEWTFSRSVWEGTQAMMNDIFQQNSNEIKYILQKVEGLN